MYFVQIKIKLYVLHMSSGMTAYHGVPQTASVISRGLCWLSVVPPLQRVTAPKLCDSSDCPQCWGRRWLIYATLLISVLYWKESIPAVIPFSHALSLNWFIEFVNPVPPVHLPWCVNGWRNICLYRAQSWWSESLREVWGTLGQVVNW